MPFGKHEGLLLEKVPASYLLWLGDELDPGQSRIKDALLEYIAENREALEMEVERGEGERR
jgi:uncharacterized protein (DUF3820 family)